MRMRLVIIFYLLFICLLMSAGLHAQIQKIYLNPKAAGSGKQSQFIDSIRFIPLEAKEGVELSQFNYVTVTANNFLIIDYPRKEIYVYKKTGAFVNKISYKSLGDDLSPRYEEANNRLVFFGDNKNFALTQRDRIEIMLDWNNPRNRKYFKKYTIDLNDTLFAIQKSSPDDKDILRAGYLYDDYYWRGQVTTSSLFKDSLDYELKLYRNNQLVKAYFPYNRINEPRFLYTQQSVALNSISDEHIRYVTRPFCDTIYKLTNDSLKAMYQIVLPLENSLPATYLTNPFKNKTERENFERNNGWLLRQVISFYETPKLIFLGIRYLTNYESYIYQKQTGVSYKTKSVRPDSTQFNLNLLADAVLQRNGSNFYKSQKAGDLISFFESHKDVVIPKELEAYLKSRPNSNAPVIVEFKLKN